MENVETLKNTEGREVAEEVVVGSEEVAEGGVSGETAEVAEEDSAEVSG